MRHLPPIIHNFFCRFGKTILLIILVVAVTSLVDLVFISPLNHSFIGLQYSNNGNVYVSGIVAQGQDLQNGSINWGTMHMGSSREVSFYVQSTSNEPIKIGYNTTEWAPPEIGSYLNIAWNYNETQVEPKQEILLTFTLTVPHTEEFENYIITNDIIAFSFNLNLYAIDPQTQ
jgi:hypothetical protein